MIMKLKYFIRRLAIKFYNKTEYFVVPKDLFIRISLNHDKPEELQKIKEEVKKLQRKYPAESSLNRAEAIIERMRIIGR